MKADWTCIQLDEGTKVQTTMSDVRLLKILLCHDSIPVATAGWWSTLFWSEAIKVIDPVAKSVLGKDADCPPAFATIDFDTFWSPRWSHRKGMLYEVGGLHSRWI